MFEPEPGLKSSSTLHEEYGVLWYVMMSRGETKLIDDLIDFVGSL